MSVGTISMTVFAVLCAGCCDTHPIYGFASNPGEAVIASDGDRGMIMWSHYEDFYSNRSFRSAPVDADGVIGPATFLDELTETELAEQWQQLGGLGDAGTTTVVWGRSNQCYDAPESAGSAGVNLRPFRTILVAFDGGSVVPVEVTASPVGTHTLVFDGSVYHALWIAEGRQLRHRTLDQTGVLGPVHELGQIPATSDPGVTIDHICVAAASDRAGTTLVVVGAWTQTFALLVSPTGETRRVWDAPNAKSLGSPYWLGGEFHVRRLVGDQTTRGAAVITSIDPITGAARDRDLPAELVDASLVRASASSFYFLLGGAELFELDANLGITGTFQPAGMDYVTVMRERAVVLGSRLSYLHEIDAIEDTPGRLQLVQLGGTGDEAWRVDVDVSSKLVTTESTCGPQTH